MAISIDTVHQRVLALANKEQRGYITPQEFNLLANKAQLLIFEQYFYDIEKALAKRNNIVENGNSTEYSDRIDILHEKISPFENYKVTFSNLVGNEATLPTSPIVHKLGTVFYSGNSYDVEVERVEKNDLEHLLRTALAAPTDTRPVYVRKTNDKVLLFPESPTVAYAVAGDNPNIFCNFISKPTQAVWGYVVVNNQALFDASTSTDFQLHASEEGELVYKILELAGIVLNKPGLVQVATNEETALITQKQ
jgi:hypothetical protein|tara:strand:+ start:775 stop:1527 length:753 start_codon:yes stop_codon:yes gene_type:complete